MDIFLLYFFLSSPFGFVQSVNQQVISSQKSVWKIETNDTRGTAFAIQPNLFVTNAHVMYLLLESDSIKDIVLSQTSDGPKLKVKRLVSLSALYDIAIFETEQQVEHLSFAKDETISDQNLFVIGYPRGEFKIIRKKDFIITEDQNTYRFLINYTDLPGVSGSPVLNEQGRLVGVVYAGQAYVVSVIKVDHLKAFLRAEIGTICKSENYKLCIKREIKVLMRQVTLDDPLAQHMLTLLAKM